MPTYQYKCVNEHHYEETRPMSAEPTRTVCPKPDCEKELKRVYYSPPIQFKGSGFYSTGPK